MDDLTIIYISASRMPEKWTDYQITQLLSVSSDIPIISVTRKPLDLGYNMIDTEKRCLWNIYRQMLRASLMADTPFVAMAEDDTLYSREHFTDFRPEMDQVSYNRSRWSLFSWDRYPIYCMRQRISNCSLIAPTKLLIEALEERMAKYPEGNDYVGEVGRWKVDRRLGVTRRKCVEWYSHVPIIQLNHRTGTDAGGGPGRRKRHGQIKAIDIPVWGKAREVASYYE